MKRNIFAILSALSIIVFSTGTHAQMFGPSNVFLVKSSGTTDSTPHTGDTTETIMGYINVPGGMPGANGCVDVSQVWLVTGSNDTWAIDIRVVAGTVSGTTGGTIMMTGTQSAGYSINSTQSICNINNTGVQYLLGVSGGFDQTNGSGNGATIDTTQPWTISINAKLNNAADSIKLKHFRGVVTQAN